MLLIQSELKHIGPASSALSTSESLSTADAFGASVLLSFQGKSYLNARKLAMYFHLHQHLEVQAESLNMANFPVWQM